MPFGTPARGHPAATGFRPGTVGWPCVEEFRDAGTRAFGGYKLRRGRHPCVRRLRGAAERAGKVFRVHPGSRGVLVFSLVLILNVSFASALRITPPQFWRTAFGSRPWTPLAGDADGDGHADLLALGPDGDSVVDLARTSPLGKALPNGAARASLGKGLVASAAGSFLRKDAADVLTLFADGSLKLVWGMARGTTAYLHADPAGAVPPDLAPQAPARTAVADFDGDGLPDVLVVDRDGKLLLLRNDGEGGFVARGIRTRLPAGRPFAAGVLAGDRFGRLVWLDEAGDVLVAPLDPKAKALGPETRIGRASPDDHLVVGRFRGEVAADVLVGQRLFVGGGTKTVVTLPEIPPLSVTKDDGVWSVADIDGNGKDDLVRHHEGHERWGAQDVVVHFAYGENESKGYYSTANDGIPDVWKTGRIKPEGRDLAALGCKVGHRDLIVEIERFENVDPVALRVQMDRAARYFASIPLTNPDGTTGIALHVVYREPWPMAEHDRIRGHFNEIFPRPGNRGIVHMMFAENDGPLDSAINADVGRFNGHWQEFVHEMGHQLDLAHDGFYGTRSGWSSDTGSAIYPSLMSYTYSYGYDNQGDWVRYSDGARASFVLNPQHLSERLPFPFETVRFLGAEPYHYRVSPTPDGKATLIDWNWNGVLGEEDVSANVNSTHGTDFGPSIDVARTTTAPILVLHGGATKARPLLFYGQGASLLARSWIGTNRDVEGDRWSEAGADYAAGLAGDPSAAAFGEGFTWVAYATAKGVALRRVTLSATGKPLFGAPTLLAGTVGVQPTVAALDGRLALLLWRNKGVPVGLMLLRPQAEGLSAGGERSLGLRSEAPVGATTGRIETGGTSLWIGRVVPGSEPEAGRTEVVRYFVEGGGVATVASRMGVTGLYAPHRMTLLWQEAGPKMPEGRLTLLAGGIKPGGLEGYEMYVSFDTPYPDYGGGWIVHRYRGPDFRGRTAPGACFFEGDVLVAFHYLDDRLGVGFYGTGATPWPVGDFDDVGHIRDYGLSHSIRNLAR